MKRYIWASTAAGVALLGTTALLGAQQVQDKGSAPSGRERGAERPDKDRPMGAERPDKDRPMGAERPDKGRPMGAERPDKDRPKGAERPGKDRPMGAERPDKDRPKGAERPDKDRPMGAERPDKDRPVGAERPDKDRPKGAERPDKDRPKGAERPDKDRPKGAERPDKDRPMGAERPDKDRPMGAERPDRTRPDTAQPDAGKGAADRTRLSERQRTDIRAKLRETRVEKTRVQINVNVGSRIPRSVRLHPLPSSVVVLAPAYRGYSYFVREDDTIVIVDARSYVVVDVIPATTRLVRGLSLSPDQRRFIYARVPKDRSVDVRVRLGLGAEVPPHVELLRFPPEVLARIPEVEGYRYVVANGDVAIVDPKDNSIALVIDED